MRRGGGKKTSQIGTLRIKCSELEDRKTSRGLGGGKPNESSPELETLEQ